MTENRLDHLGYVTYKVNDLLDEKIVEVSRAKLHVSCIEQRIRTYQGCMDHKGITQQSLVISTPKYHKLYILPVGETMIGANLTKSKYVGCILEDEEEWINLRNVVRAIIEKHQHLQRQVKGVHHHLLYKN
ncbi:unnamed protein product [Vicia faba]|uniref:Uncharacterized protein n=1 Tax=Vicia faba TaxID=3906 RepID=A0AAV0ZAM0_VICFA|nr:unnamed protein product [Vicia faba]